MDGSADSLIIDSGNHGTCCVYSFSFQTALRWNKERETVDITETGKISGARSRILKVLRSLTKRRS